MDDAARGEQEILGPTAVRRADGREEPFRSDRVVESVHHAHAAVADGRGTAFVAQQLASAVVHFLRETFDRQVPTTAEIGDTVATVLRELGHPEVAEASRRPRPAPDPQAADFDRERDEWATQPHCGADPERIARHLGSAGLEGIAERRVYSPDIVALSAVGWLDPFGMRQPFSLHAAEVDTFSLAAGCAGPMNFLERIDDALWDAADRCEGVISVPHLDAAAACLDPERATEADEFAAAAKRMFVRLARARERQWRIGLWATVPHWLAERLDGGPLFAADAGGADAGFARAVAESLERSSWRSHRDIWCERLVDDDGETPVAPPHGTLRRAAAEPAAPVVEQVVLSCSPPDAPATIDAWIRHMTPLCEAAVRAAGQKRDFLRRVRPDLLAAGRATVAIVPHGLEMPAGRLAGERFGESEASVSAALRLFAGMRRACRRAARDRHLTAVMPLDPWSFEIDEAWTLAHWDYRGQIEAFAALQHPDGGHSQCWTSAADFDAAFALAADCHVHGLCIGTPETAGR